MYLANIQRSSRRYVDEKREETDGKYHGNKSSYFNVSMNNAVTSFVWYRDTRN